MKKLLTILATSLVIASTLLAQAAGETTDNGSIRIGISQLMAHSRSFSRTRAWT